MVTNFNMLRVIRFTEEERQEIKTAVGNFEREVSGELVPVFLQNSDEYAEANWYGAVVGGLLGIVSVGLTGFLWQLPPGFSILQNLLLFFGMMALGYLFPLFFSQIRIYLAGDTRVEEMVRLRAMQYFLDHEVFNTRHRTGILLFISAMERKVVVLADSGINAVVQAEQWEEVVRVVIDGIRKKQVSQGIVRAIGLCKTLLLENGFVVGPDDINELPDDLIEK